MAIYSTFFLCAPEQLPVGFPGWKLPLPEPVVRKSFNPFTRKEMTTTTRRPEWDDVSLNEVRPREHRAVAISGSYDAYLEGRLPSSVQSQPHWCSKNLMSIDLEPLLAATPGVDNPHLEAALYAHPLLNASIDEFPEDFVAKLCSAGEPELRSIAEKWAESPLDLHDGWTVDDALHILHALAKLARQKMVGQRMYLLTEA